mgnify:CR=1 FL=1
MIERKPEPADDGGLRTRRMKDFARRLNRLRIEKDWTQSDLAKKSGLLRNIVSLYCRGEATPGELNVIRLAKALGCEPKDLIPGFEIAGESDMPRPAPAPETETVEFRTPPGGKAVVRVQRVVKNATAMRILEALKDDPSDGA